MLKNIVLTALMLCMYFVSSSQEVKEEVLCTKICCCCCNYDPTPAGVSLSHLHSKGEWMISFQSMFMKMDGLLSGTNEISENEIFMDYLMSPDKMSMNMYMMMGMYGISNRFTAMVMLNYLKQDMEMNMFSAGGHVHGGSEGSNIHLMNTSGISDAQTHLLFSLYENEKSLLMLSAGINLPLGSIEEKAPLTDPMYPDMRYPYAMQNGSGTFDIIPGITYTYQKGKSTCSIQQTYYAPLNSNSVGYRKGNESMTQAWFAYKWLPFLSSSFRTQFLATGKIIGSDSQLYAFTEPAANPANYGGERIQLFAGTQFSLRRPFWKHFRMGAEYGFPVFEDLSGIQMKTSGILNFSLSVSY